MSDADTPAPRTTRRLLDEPLRVCVETMVEAFGAYEAIRAADGTIVDFEIVHVNDLACASLGFSREALIGRRLLEVFPEVGHSDSFELYTHVVNTGAPLVREGRERGGRFWDLRLSRLGDGFVASWRDVTTRKQLEIDLQRSNEALRARAEELAVLMEAMPASVWIASDPACHDVRGSRQARELLRMEATDNISATPAPHGPPAPTHFEVRHDGINLAPHQLPLQRAARGEDVRNFEEEIVFTNGERLWLYGTAMPLRRPDGTPRGAIAAFTDITEYKRIEQALRVAAEAKDQFLAMISHELRTPLNAVLGYLQMLEQGTIPEARRADALATIGRNARLQLKLIDDILDISSITRGKLSLEMQRVALEPLVNAAVHTLLPSASTKGVDLRCTIDTTGASVRADERRLCQVLDNVLSNAVKFTPAGGRIEVTLGPSNGGYAIAVRDTGIGIASEFVPHVFEKFSQEHIGSARLHGGLGLGLSIASHLVDAHGGTITAHSDGPGLGATFTINLPCESGAADAAAAV
jgi:PAS domain S-box-containing protein